MTEPYLTVKEAAHEYFHDKISARMVYKLVAQGRLATLVVGSKILIFRTSLDTYLASARREPLDTAEIAPDTPRRAQPVPTDPATMKKPASSKAGKSGTRAGFRHFRL